VKWVAIVYSDGSVEEVDGTGAADYLDNQQLLAYAQAFLASERHSAAFYWRCPDDEWLRVSLCDSTEPGRCSAVLTLTPARLPADLTPRELDVLTLMASGLSNRQIADRLVTSSRTVSTQVERILGKLGQPSRAGAAAVAADRGYLRLPLPGAGDIPDGLLIGFLHARAADTAVSNPGPVLPYTSAGASVSGGSPPSSAPAGPGRAVGWLARRPLRIGSLFPLHGPASLDGREMLNGSALAISELNARGGVGGRKLEQVVVDADIFSADGIERAFSELFAADVDAVISGYVFAMDKARDMAAEYGAPYLNTNASESEAQAVRDNPARYRCIFQVSPTELYYGAGFVRCLNSLRDSGQWRAPSSRLVFVETPLPSGQVANELTTELAARSGWQIAGIETVRALGADWAQVVRQISRVDPAAVMISNPIAGELAAFQRQIARWLPETLVYAVYAPSVPEFLQLAGGAAEGLVWATSIGTYSDQVGQRFRSDYLRAFSRQAGLSLAGTAYDQVHLLAQAWMSVPNPGHRAAVTEQLRRVRYRGVNGTYYLDNDGQTSLSFPDVTRDPSLGLAHLVFQVQHGVHRIVAPDLYAESSFRPPHRSLVS
jgi:branched-chain amino acid transport system substrate-binding protein